MAGVAWDAGACSRSKKRTLRGCFDTVGFDMSLLSIPSQESPEMSQVSSSTHS